MGRLFKALDIMKVIKTTHVFVLILFGSFSLAIAFHRPYFDGTDAYVRVNTTEITQEKYFSSNDRNWEFVLDIFPEENENGILLEGKKSSGSTIQISMLRSVINIQFTNFESTSNKFTYRSTSKISLNNWNRVSVSGKCSSVINPSGANYSCGMMATTVLGRTYKENTKYDTPPIFDEMYLASPLNSGSALTNFKGVMAKVVFVYNDAEVVYLLNGRQKQDKNKVMAYDGNVQEWVGDSCGGTVCGSRSDKVCFLNDAGVPTCGTCSAGCDDRSRCLRLSGSTWCVCIAADSCANYGNFDVLCNGSLCNNRGICFATVQNSQQCVCRDPWSGAHCGNCGDAECSGINAVDCVDNGTAMYCRCSPGFEGASCDEDIDYCKNVSCFYGTCIDNLLNYTCDCNEGYEGSNCSLEINECDSDPCTIGRICLDDINEFRCVCPEGFTGESCDVDILECESGPCIYGDCIDLVNSYACNCFSGYTGHECGTEINECSSQPCRNGTCEDTVDGFICQCSLDFTGTLCELEIDDCTSNACANGTCEDLVHAYTCHCSTGFTGPFCDVEIDDCSSLPCRNGVCEDRHLAFLCQCAAGYTGTLCDFDEDDCSSNPCANGICEDMVNAYSCHCTPGYTGTVCDSYIDDCSSSQCRNGVCEDSQLSFLCKCSAGFTGPLCDFDIDDCISKPCVNGTCEDMVNAYICRCSAGFTGASCSFDIDDCSSAPCMNGDCEDMHLAYLCQCSAGFTGITCDFDINECLSQPCAEGSCLDFIGWYSCACSAGMTGTLCDVNIDECHSEPCVTGLCLDQLDGYLCRCPSGMKRGECDTDNACFSSPCLWGMCDNIMDGFICICPENSTGQYCNVAVVNSGFTVNPSEIESLVDELIVSSPTRNEPPERISTILSTLQELVIVDNNDTSKQDNLIKYIDGISEDQDTTKTNGISEATQQLQEGNGVLSASYTSASVEVFTELADNVMKTSEQLQLGNGVLNVNYTNASVELFTGLADKIMTSEQLQEGSGVLNVSYTNVSVGLFTGLVDKVMTTSEQLQAGRGVINASYTNVSADEVKKTVRQQLQEVSGVLNASYTKVSVEQLTGLADKVQDVFDAMKANLSQMNFNEIESTAQMFVVVLDSLLRIAKRLQRLNSKNWPADDLLSLSDCNQKLTEKLKDFLRDFTRALKPGDPVIMLATGGFDARLAKVRDKDLANVNFNSGIKKINIPSPTVSNTGSDSTCCELQAVFFNENPFWSTNADVSDDSKSVIQFFADDCEDNQTGYRRRRFVGNILAHVARKYTVDTLKPDEKGELFLFEKALQDPLEIAYHYVKISSYSNYHMSFVPISNPVLHVLVGFDFAPTTLNYSRFYKTGTNQSRFNYAISKNDIRKNLVQNLVIGIKQVCSDISSEAPNCTRNLAYRYVFGSFQCSSWSNELNTWELLKKCQVLKETSKSLTMRPGQFGPVDPMFLIPMNTLNLKMISENFDKSDSSSYVVLITCFIFLVVFVFVLGLLRRKDNQDHINWMVCTPPDNNPTFTYLYELHIHTGDVKNADMSGVIYVNIHGSNCSIMQRRLVDSEGLPVNYSKDGVRSFLLTSLSKIGEVEEVEFLFPKELAEQLSWFLNIVVAVDLENLTYYPFFVRSLVTLDNLTPWDTKRGVLRDKEGAQLDDLYSISLKQKLGNLENRYLLKKNISNFLVEGHMWISSFNRRIKSTFTRVQRWTCCVFAMTGVMLLNALWFDTSLGASAEGNTRKAAMRVVLPAVYSTLIVSVMSSMLALVYAKIKISEKEADLHYISFAPISQLRKNTTIPHWCVYIAHGVVLMFVVASLVVCVLFSLMWGPVKSQIWLCAFLVGVCFNIFIWQPIVLLCFILFMTLIKKKDSDLALYENFFKNNVSNSF